MGKATKSTNTTQGADHKYFQANSNINPEQWRAMQHSLHSQTWDKGGSDLRFLLTATILAVAVATLARWDTLQNVCLGHVGLEDFAFNPEFTVTSITILLLHLKGHKNDRLANRTGWVRHRRLLECSTFHLALYLWLT